MKRLDAHRYESHLQTAIHSVKKAEISARNKELIFAYYEQGMIRGLSTPRLIKHLDTLKLIAKLLQVDFDKATKQDIERFVGRIQKREDYSAWTKQDYQTILKCFYKWLKGKGEEYPEEVRWIKATIRRRDVSLPGKGELLSENDIEQVLKVATHPRDKAFVAVLYESGCRIGELLGVRLQDVAVDQHGLLLTVTGKTGSRKVRLIQSTPYLMTWLDNHPLQEDKTSPVWINIGTRCHLKLLEYDNARKLLQTLFTKAGIKKPCNPHLFRHSRATFLANHLTEFQMNHYFGWIQGSDMPATYVHLSGKDLDGALLQLHGLQTPKEAEESRLQPQKCSRCNTLNTHESQYCKHCAGPLSLKTAMEADEGQEQLKQKKEQYDTLMAQLLQDPQIQTLVKAKISALALH